MTDPNGLPEGWTRTTLGSVCDRPQYGWTTSASDSGTLQLLRTTDITRRLDWATVPYCRDNPADIERFLLRPGDIVVSRAGSVGASALLGECPLAVFASYLIRFRPLTGIDPRYVRYYLQSPDFWAHVSTSSAGIALANINARKLEAAPFPLAPFTEQQRIVAEIEKHFTRLDAAEAALKRVQANLKRHRAAVLKAAVEGRLVPTDAALAAAENRGIALGIDVVRQAGCEREHRWRNAGTKRYPEPLPRLECEVIRPEGWTVASLDQLTYRIGDTDHRMPRGTESGVAYISTKDFVEPDGIDFDNAKRIATADYTTLARKIHPETGDILLSRYGTVGKVRLVPPRPDFQTSYSIAIVKTLRSISNHFLIIALQSPPLQEQMRRSVRASGQPDLGLEYIKRLGLAVPPLAEQQRIVVAVDRHFSIIRAVELQLTSSLVRSTRFRFAILKAAFCGALNPDTV